MTALLTLWQVSLFLCSVALLTLTVILLARLIAERRSVRRQAERRRVTQMLLHQEGSLFVLTDRRLEEDVAVQVAVEMTEFVRGPEREALLTNAEALGIPEILLRQSVSWKAQERLLAAEALAMFGSGKHRALVMLDDPNPDVRLGAALALAENGAAPRASILVRQLGLGTSERSLLIASLMRDLVEANPASVQDLLADRTLPDPAKLAAVNALAATGRVENAPLIAAMAQDPEQDHDSLPSIYRALGRIGHPSGHAAILKGLSHSHWEVRASAAQAAGECGLISATAHLGELLGDNEFWVRFRSGEALWRLGPRGQEVLEVVANSSTALASEAAARTIQERTRA